MSSRVDGLRRQGCKKLSTFQQAGLPIAQLDSAELGDLVFKGFELVPPGIVVTSEWRPDNDIRPLPSEVGTNGAVGRKL